jgi:hypothetical protein
MLQVTRDQVVAFRAASLRLVDRLPASRLDEAMRPCGLQDTPPGNAAVGAAARVEGLTLEAWERALEEEKTLVQLYAMRGSPFVVATSDLAVFTLGLSPVSEAAALQLITSGLRSSVEESGVPARELVARLSERAREVLEAGAVARTEFARQLGSAVPEPLRGRFADEEQLSVLTLTVARLVAHEGAFLIGPRIGRTMSLVRTDGWLGQGALEVPVDDARAELVRRYLRGFGPVTAEDFAWWSQAQQDAAARRILEDQARELWKLVEAELEAVERQDGTTGYVLGADVSRLSSPPSLEGVVRLLPPHDPLLMLRDRETLVPAVQHGRIWRSMHSPGIVLADGAPVATWKARKSGGKLSVTVEALASPVGPRLRDAIAEEAAHVAPLRECASAELAFA